MYTLKIYPLYCIYTHIHLLGKCKHIKDKLLQLDAISLSWLHPLPTLTHVCYLLVSDMVAQVICMLSVAGDEETLSHKRCQR